MEQPDLYDVLKIRINDPRDYTVMVENKTESAAEVFIRIAVARQGVDTHFFSKVPAGQRPSPSPTQGG